MYKLVVTGYIREFETSLLKKIVPLDIKLLCIEYYYSNSKLVLIQNEDSEKCILITDFNEDEETKTNTVWNAHAFNHVQPFIIEDSAICCYSNITFPQHVLNATNINHNNNVIFKCDKECYAIILNDNDFDSYSEKMQPYCWKLPSFKYNRYANTLLYSKWYGLLSIGGMKGSTICNDIMQLSFNKNMDNTDTKFKMEWKQIGKMERKLKDITCTMINDRTLLICGGRNASNSDSKQVLIYDFEIGEWIGLRQSKYARSKMGIYFDKMEKKIFCVGGNESSFAVNKAEYFDLERNEWFRLPNTSMKHGWNPLVWKHSNNKNILLVASYITNSIETYDLRDAMRAQYTRRFNDGWRTIYGPQNSWPMYESSLENVFKTTFVQYGLSKCNERLLRFNDDYF